VTHTEHEYALLEEQIKQLKEDKKQDRKTLASMERAYWESVNESINLKHKLDAS